MWTSTTLDATFFAIIETGEKQILTTEVTGNKLELNMADLPEEYTVRLVNADGDSVSDPFFVSTVTKIMKIEAKKADNEAADVIVNWDAEKADWGLYLKSANGDLLRQKCSSLPCTVS